MSAETIPEVPLWRVHELKTWPEPFAALVSGQKTHEVRKSDRDFRVGDLLRLREWEPRAEHPDGGWYTGQEAWREVTYISHGGTWGLPEGLCVLSIAFTDRSGDGGFTYSYRVGDQVIAKGPANTTVPPCPPAPKEGP